MKSVLIGFIGVVLYSGVSLAADKAELKNEVEKINYSVGYQIGGDFKAQGVELNSDVLVKGIEDAIKKNPPLISKEQMNETLVNLKKRIVAEQQSAELKSAAEYRKAGAAFLEKNAKEKGVTVLPSGVQYKVLKEGTGKKPTMKDDVKVHYKISRVDGKEIGSTYVGGKPRIYPLAKAVPGLQEVLPLMSEGARWQIVLPMTTAVGGREPLDEMGAMIYELELLSVIPGK